MLNQTVLENPAAITDAELETALKTALGFSEQPPLWQKILLVPPDITRSQSGAGRITAILYRILKGAHIDILPALGTHAPMTREEQVSFFGPEIPPERYIIHNWRTGVTDVGTVPGDFVEEVSEGLMTQPMQVQLSNPLLDPSYDLILSIGQVVPHEVVGMANYTKNLVVGCGGSAFINQSHMLGAFYGMERIMGRDHSPVRKVFDYAQEHFLDKLPLAYILTAADAGGIKGLYCGQGRALFEKALALSTKLNMTHLDKPIKKCVVYLDPHEFHSTWLGNKAIYRTRLAMADGGQLIILAPGVKRFGEDDENDVLIRKYGYVGRLKVLELVKEQEDLQNNLSVAAHLIHGSSDDRFSITYCAPFLSPQEIEKANFIHANYNEMLQKYNPETLKDGWQIIDNEEIYYISNPALGLWGLKT